MPVRRRATVHLVVIRKAQNLGDRGEYARDKQTMGSRINILVQTTIRAITDDWNIDRFSLLRDHLVSLTDESGEPLYNLTARNREVNVDGNDAVLSVLDGPKSANCND